MNRYTIYCTESQTKKALKLGAPIRTHWFIVECIWLHKYPTAEQMIGWLEEQGVIFNIAINCFDEYKVIMSKSGSWDNIANINWNENRKQATLAAIDAALEYLIKAKEEER